MDILNWLQEWYSKNCEDTSVHYFGVKIETLDNPGWTVKIELLDTKGYFEGKIFEEMKIERSDDDWLFCKVENKEFKGACGPENLEEMLSIFKVWVESTL